MILIRLLFVFLFLILLIEAQHCQHCQHCQHDAVHILEVSSASHADASHRIKHTENSGHAVFLEIGDVHLDVQYDPSGDPGDSHCQGSNKDSLLVAGLDPDTSYPYGQYGCDPPELLLNNTVLAMKTLFPPQTIQAVFFVGDAGPHHHFKDARDVFEAVKTVTLAVTDAFPDTQFIPMIGNHDLYPPYSVTCDDLQLNALWSLWSDYLPSSANATFLHGGYFALRPDDPEVAFLPQKTRFVVLNTVLYATESQYGRSREDPDPCGQFEFLEGELKLAASNGESVLIAMHIPPGGSRALNQLWEDPYIVRFEDIVRLFESTITIELGAHVHRDLYRSIHETSEAIETISTIFSYGSVTPISGNNPGFRAMQFETDSEGHTSMYDFATYMFDLKDASSSQMERVSDRGGGSVTVDGWPIPPSSLPYWSFEYSFRSTYQVEEETINPAAMDRITEKLSSDSDYYDATFGKYLRAESTSDVCKAKNACMNMCGARWIDNDALSKCLNSC